MEKKEFVRFAIQTPIEFEGEEKRTISGKIPYGTKGANLGITYRLISGCFSNSLGNDIYALFNHDWEKRLARTSKGTLILSDESDGMKISMTPTTTSWGADCVAAIEDGLMDGFSFGGYILSDNWIDENGERVEEILEFDLLEVSPVFNPVFLAGAELVVNSKDPEQENKPVPMNLYRAKQMHAKKTKL